MDYGLWTGRGLTLVELMVATSILAIGIVLVGRGLLTASSALNSVESRTQAFQFLEAKMAGLQQQAYERGGVEPGATTGTMELNHRPSRWALEIVPVEIKPPAPAVGPTEPSGSSGAAPASSVKLAEVRLSVSWQEAQRAQDVALVTYLEQHETQAPES